MTHSPSFSIVECWQQPVPISNITVAVRREFNRRRVAELDHLIDVSWSRKEAALNKKKDGEDSSKHLFNGTKFRLHGAYSEAGKLHLQLGITDYKTNLGSCENIGEYTAYAKGLSQTESGAEQSVDDVEPLLAQALGIEAILVTADNLTVLFRRSQHVADMPGWYCCAGGHPEPSNLCCHASFPAPADDSDWLETQADWFSHAASNVVARELYESAVDEIVAELGLPRGTLVNKGLIGVIKSTLTHKPDLIFLVQTTLRSDEVRDIYNRRSAEETFESEEGSLVATPLTAAGVEDICKKLCITPPSVACLELGLLVLRAMGPT